jgi:signal transduction histidine kinase
VLFFFKPIKNKFQTMGHRLISQIRSRALQTQAGQTRASATVQFSPGWLRVARISWFILMVLAVAIFISALPGYLQSINSRALDHAPQGSQAFTTLFFPLTGSLASLASSALSLFLSGLLFRRKFENPAVAAVSFYLLGYGIIMTGPLEAWGGYWMGSSDFAINAQTLLMATPTVALFVLFPNGQFVPRWARWILIASLPWNLMAFIFPLFPYNGENTFSLAFQGIFWIALLGLGFYAQVVRYRQVSTLAERQQTKWVLFGFGLWIGYLILSSIPYFYLTSLPSGSAAPWWAPISELGWWLSLSIIPVTLTLAITRSRLWNIDIVINRTLVYGILTVATMGLYILVVGALGNLLHVGDNTFIAFLTTGLVAILFQPLRQRVQGWVNRWMYGERDDPVAVLSRLGETLERTGSPEDSLARITETVARALKLPYAAIQFETGKDPVASFGLPRPEVQTFPLVYQAETNGNLLVAPRAPGEPFSPSDLRLLENIAHQAGAAAHAARLTADLRHSRQSLITAREEERRRIRRDLHDGLGPNLASLTLRLDTLRNLLHRDPQRAEQLLEELKKQTQATIQDVRTLVYELRPPALDELGLVGAIRTFLDQHSASQPVLSLEVSSTLPPLPAAIEVAAYRIGMEGLNNLLRHAQASHGIVRLSQEPGYLLVEIHDDGVGAPPGYTAGIGLISMRERAEELGGSFEILSHQPGFHLRARLPFTQE